MPGHILVTGSAGFIGSHLVDRLLGAGRTVVGLDNLSMGFERNFQHNMDHGGFRFVHGDILDRDLLVKESEGARAIVHLAAMKIPRYGKALETLQVNQRGTENVLEAGVAGGARVVFASTSDVYGKNPNLPFEEESDLVMGPPTVARWAYAVSKMFDEHLAFAYADAHDVEVVALRFFGSYGPRHHLSWWGGPQSVFIQQVLEGKEISIHGDGKQTRSFTYISDTVEGVFRAVEEPEAAGQVFNLGNDDEITILELATLIHRLIRGGEEPKITFVPYESFTGKRYEDVRRRVPDAGKAKRVLGVAAKIGLEEGMARTIEWHRREVGL